MEIPGLAGKYGGTVPHDVDRYTLVARLPDDPFVTAVGDPAHVKADIRKYCVLAALSDSTTPLTRTTVSKWTREAARPLLVARGLMADDVKQMPKGFRDQNISELLEAMVTDGLALDASTPRTAAYSSTSGGDAEKLKLAELYGITPEKSS